MWLSYHPYCRALHISLYRLFSYHHPGPYHRPGPYHHPGFSCHLLSNFYCSACRLLVYLLCVFFVLLFVLLFFLSSVSLFFFFFQAEDGIRVLVRSRGLGDVYKRQHLRLNVLCDSTALCPPQNPINPMYNAPVQRPSCAHSSPVSYTHLTLPTIYSV